MKRHLAWLVPVALLTGCASLQNPDPSNTTAYCTEQNGYRLGSQGYAYFGNCPKESERAFLAGLDRGRAVRPAPPQAMPYFDRMQQTEKDLLATSNEADRAKLRTQLSELQWWAMHIVNDPGSYSVDN